MNYSIEFTQDYAIHKKGDTKSFSTDLCNMLVKDLGVAKYTEEKQSTQVPTITKKAKAKK